MSLFQPESSLSAANAATGPSPRPGLRRGQGLLLVVLGLLLHVGQLGGPFRDGQDGNCGAMFAIFARNAAALGLVHGALVPVLDPLPAADGLPRVTYSHHPPGLPWMVMLASLLPLPVQTAARLVALLLTLLTALLLADLAARLAGRRAALAAGVLALALPAGLRHGLLVNYETAALPPMLYLVRVLLLERGKAALGAAWAASSDWIALLPLLVLSRRVCRARWWRALGAALVVTAAFSVLSRSRTPGSLGETLGQGLAATFLSPQFDARTWISALGGFLGDLYGLALVPAGLALLLVPRGARLLRRTLVALLLCGLVNVGVFALHATTHEHFSLILLPFVALSTAVLLFPRDELARPPAALGLAALLVILGAGLARERVDPSARGTTHEAELADAFARVSDERTLYVRPEGASLVFLHEAGRHLVPFPAHDVEAARAAAAQHRARFGLDLPAEVVLARTTPVPDWLSALGPGQERGDFRFWPLPAD
ncbi:MAG: hypothetical protein H6825_04420 [Planctomycetes bacterium]|nr:hypothetical protein [Planctomycetota bacterium]